MYKRNTVLVIDDEEIIKSMLINVIVNEYEVIGASNGKEAFKLLKERHEEIAAIVLDLIMPVMDGIAFLEEFNKHEEYQEIPVIVATSNEEEEKEKRCLELGVWDFVIKPYNPTLLLFRLKNVIEKSRMIIHDHDMVTGIYTKMKFYQEVRQMLLNVKGEKFAFVRFDIDRFKMINNFYGTQEGDKVLKSVAGEMRKVAKKTEHFVYGRLENDVFACCLPYDEERVESIANQLEVNLKKVNEDYNIKVSCGVYIIDDYSMDVSEMYDRAFLAAKECKGKFISNIAYYDESMIEGMRYEQYIINEVNKALEEEQFVVYLQPKVNLVNDMPCGAEALVRWNHPTRGMLTPNEFIPIYERNGIIGKLDHYMWEHVCKLLRKWIDEGKKPEPISVNVSRVNLYNPQLIHILTDMVKKYDVPPELLYLELTESAFVEDHELITKTMEKLHKMGFKIMMDDFGSGYSSLNILKDMELDFLKVDMKFLQGKEFNGRGEKILTSIIRMSKWMKIPAIVEGVETIEQIDFLKCIGCDYAQGFYYAKPMPVREYEAYVERTNRSASPIPTEENFYLVNELWNTRSKISRFFDLIHVPIAVFEYHNKKFDLLRANAEFDRLFGVDGGNDAYIEEKLMTAKQMLLNEFSKVKVNHTMEDIEIAWTNNTWYRARFQVIANRGKTLLIMVTFLDITTYKPQWND